MMLPCLTPAMRQRGIGTLAVSMLLLFGASIVIFYLNRGLIFEQKTSANQVRATSAFEVAEAGVEWAVGMLNGTVDIEPDCTPATASVTTSFRQRYLQTGYPGSAALAIATTTFPGCKMNGTTLTCSCPTAGTASLGSNVLPSFTVSFEPVRDPAGTLVIAGVNYDAAAVRITSRGCTAQSAACTTATSSNSDATAIVSAIVKNVPDLRAAPQAALTCGLNCDVSGSYTIINREVSSNGYLVNAGRDITSSNAAVRNYQTIPGQPIQNALVANDDSLRNLAGTDTTCSNSAMFREYFGTNLADYAASESVATISCNNPNNCGSALISAYENNFRNFYFPDGFALNEASLPSSYSGVLGLPGEGVRLVSPGHVDINGNITINGLVFSNSADFRDLGTGTASINGAMITCAAYRNTGSGSLTYTSANLGSSGLGAGQMVRVPGSWRDY